MAESTITSRLLGELPRFLELLCNLLDACGSNAVDPAAFDGLLEFKSLVAAAAEHQEPWQELWQRPELLWSGPNSLLESVPLLSALCERLLSTACNCSLLLAAAQVHLAVLRGWLEHATPVQLTQLAEGRGAQLLESAADVTLEMLPLLFQTYGTQQSPDNYGAALLKQAMSRARQLGAEQAERQELQAMQQNMLQVAAGALWLTATVMRIAPCSQLSGVLRGLPEWARVLKEAEACAGWEQDTLSLELPTLLAEVTSAFFNERKLLRKQQQDALVSQGELAAFATRSALRYMRAELEKCLQEPPFLERSYSLLGVLNSGFLAWIAADENILELWVKVLSLVDEVWEAQANRTFAGAEPLGDPLWDQLTALKVMRLTLVPLYPAVLWSARHLDARAAQFLEAAALKCAAAALKCATAAVRTLRTVHALVYLKPSMQGGKPSVGDAVRLSHVVADSANLLRNYLSVLAGLEAPAFSSPAARRPGAPRPPGTQAVAAALDAVRLGEAVLRCALGECREALIHFDQDSSLQCSPANLCTFALNIISKWATGKLPAASSSQPELYLLQLTRGQSGLDALLSLQATQRKLAQEIAQGLPVAAEEREDQSMKLHHSLWIILNVTTEVSLSVASRLGSGSCSDGGSGGCTGGGMPIVREKEAVACLAITAAKHLASATLSHVAGADIFVQPDCVTPHPFLGVAQVLLSLNRHSMLPSALQLGAGELLGSIACGQMELQPSAEEAAKVARRIVALFTQTLMCELLPSAVHGGLLRHAVEVYLAWLRTDAFQVVQANGEVLETMETRFLEVCKVAEGHPGLHGIYPLMVQWAQLLMGDGCNFLKCFPRTKKEMAQAKERLINGWSLRAQHLCPNMEEAARAVVHAELAPTEVVKYIPVLSHSPLVGSQAPTSLAAAREAAADAAATALAQSISEACATIADYVLQERDGAAAKAGGARLRRAALSFKVCAAKLQQWQQPLPTNTAQELLAVQATIAEPAQPAQPATAHVGGAAVEAAEGTSGVTAAASGDTYPQAQRVSSCPLMFAVRDIAVSRAGCANVCCSNLSGASESELPRPLCKGCLSVCYCSEDCGREDWPGHGSICRLVRLMRLGLAHCRRPSREANF